MKVTITMALPAAALAGYGLRGLLHDAPQHYEDRNCLDLVDEPIAIFLDNRYMRATAHRLGPGWVIIPNPLPPR